MNNCTLMALSFSRLGTSRKVANEDVGVQEELIRVSKKILESPTLDAIVSFDRATRAEIDSLAVPASRGIGTIVLPHDHLGRALDYLPQILCKGGRCRFLISSLVKN